MPRNGTGTFTLVSGNPVVTGTTIESNWANTTLSDIATTLTDSLSRSGQGGMTAALRIADGTQGAPGVGFANETGSGFYRAGTGEVWAVVQGAQTLNLDANGVYVPADKTTTVDGAFVFNEAGADKDARFEGDTDANLLFTDASTDRVGIGTATPASKLDVVGDVTVSGAVNAGSVNATTLDLTNLEVTNIKAKDGTASASIADSTGVMSLVANPVLSGGTANGVLYLNGSKVATSGTDLVFSGTNGFITSGGGAFQGATAPSSGAGIELSYGALAGIGRILGYNRTGAARVPIVIDGSYVAGYADGTEGMRLTSTGLGIGTSSPAFKFDAQRATAGTVGRFFSTGGTDANISIKNNTQEAIVGADSTQSYLLNAGAYPWTFWTSNTERARITSGGDLLVGTTSTTMGQTGVTIIPALGGQVGYIQIGHANGTSSGNGYADFFYNAVSIGSITQNGTTAVAFNTTSDRRLKDNIVPAPSASDVIDAIEIVSHDWKSAPDEHVTYGVIAQDLALVAPQAVLQGDDGDTVEKPWGVDYSKLVPMLIKELQSLRARVAALEAQP